MDKNLFDGIQFDQVGIIVRNVDEAVRQFENLLGIKGFNIITYPDASKKDQVYYKEELTGFSIKVAFIKMGNMELELIEPLQGRSIYQEFLDTHGPGIQHIRTSVDEDTYKRLCKQLENEGISLIARGPGVRSMAQWRVYATRDILGADVELRIA